VVWRMGTESGNNILSEEEMHLTGGSTP
jgi:hypothetical protein